MNKRTKALRVKQYSVVHGIEVYLDNDMHTQIIINTGRRQTDKDETTNFKTEDSVKNGSSRHAKIFTAKIISGATYCLMFHNHNR